MTDASLLREEAMPDRATLEAFLAGLAGGPVTVVFDAEKGVFVWVRARE